MLVGCQSGLQKFEFGLQKFAPVAVLVFVGFVVSRRISNDERSNTQGPSLLQLFAPSAHSSKMRRRKLRPAA